MRRAPQGNVFLGWERGDRQKTSSINQGGARYITDLRTRNEPGRSKGCPRKGSVHLIRNLDFTLQAIFLHIPETLKR